MSVIKEVYDVARTEILAQRQMNSIKRALATESALNRKFLREVEKNDDIDDARRKELLGFLAIDELSAAVKYEIPYEAICQKTVDKQMIGQLKVDRTLGYDLGKLVKSLYLMIAYIKKDFNNPKINLKSKLEFICKYNILLERMLS
ncbi:MAG: hypothetical protein ACOYNC_18550 [Bacteroidales bacterium]